jgi:hypothetical protein
MYHMMEGVDRLDGGTGTSPVSQRSEGGQGKLDTSGGRRKYDIWYDWVVIRENPNYTIVPLDSRNQESVQIPGFWNPIRFLIRENPNCTILPLDSRNQESAL